MVPIYAARTFHLLQIFGPLLCDGVLEALCVCCDRVPIHLGRLLEYIGVEGNTALNRGLGCGAMFKANLRDVVSSTWAHLIVC